MLTVIHLFPLSQFESYRQETWHAVTTILYITHTHSVHLLVFRIMPQMLNIKGGFELRAGSRWWWGWWCSRPGQWTVGILWSPTDLLSPGFPTSLSYVRDKRSSIFPFVGSYWSVEMSCKLNYLLKCSLKTLSIIYCARQRPGENAKVWGLSLTDQSCVERKAAQPTCICECNNSSVVASQPIN